MKRPSSNNGLHFTHCGEELALIVWYLSKPGQKPGAVRLVVVLFYSWISYQNHWCGWLLSFLDFFFISDLCRLTVINRKIFSCDELCNTLKLSRQCYEVNRWSKFLEMKSNLAIEFPTKMMSISLLSQSLGPSPLPFSSPNLFGRKTQKGFLELWPTLSTDLVTGAMSAMCSSVRFLSQSSCCLVKF